MASENSSSNSRSSVERFSDFFERQDGFVRWMAVAAFGGGASAIAETYGLDYIERVPIALGAAAVSWIGTGLYLRRQASKDIDDQPGQQG